MTNQLRNALACIAHHELASLDAKGKRHVMEEMAGFVNALAVVDMAMSWKSAALAEFVDIKSAEYLRETDRLT